MGNIGWTGKEASPLLLLPKVKELRIKIEGTCVESWKACDKVKS